MYSMGERSVAANCARVTLIIVNLVFLAFACVIIGLGGHLLYLGVENDYSVITGGNIVPGAALLVIAGGIMFIITSIAIIGACVMWRPLLLIYIVCVIFLVVVVVAASILGFVFHDEVTDELEDKMFDALKDYRSGPDEPGYNEEVNDVVAYVQETFRCCGVNSSRNWFDFNPDVTRSAGNEPPRECLCDLDEDSDCANFNFTYFPPGPGVEVPAEYNAWDRGCLDLLEENLTTMTAITISASVLGIIIGIIELFSIFLAIGLIICISREKKDPHELCAPCYSI